MTALTIRRLAPGVKERLRVRAARHGRSMEEEARSILQAAVSEPSGSVRLGSAIRGRFSRLRGIELELPSREPLRSPPKFR